MVSKRRIPFRQVGSEYACLRIKEDEMTSRRDLFRLAGAAAAFGVATLAGTRAEADWMLPSELNGRGRDGSGSGFWFGPGSSPIPRQQVSFGGRHAPGSVLIDTSERRLYLVLGDGQAMRYGVGVGRQGFEWTGSKTISRKAEWPDWTPPPQMLRRRPDLPRFMKGGPNNPLGARALYLGSSLYRIHGSNEPETIGQAVSSGCIRMTNDDVVHLYDRVRIGTRVTVVA
jgi:lipoprotein-anchoring transpeptidase ErfK/SrfK